MPKLRAGVAMRDAADWAEAALDAIAEGGLRSLAIPELAQKLGVTKGSFYWHFAGLDALIETALARWEADVRQALDATAKMADPRQRLITGLRESLRARRSHSLFITLASSDDPRVVAVLRRVSSRRLAFLVDAYRDLGLEGKELRAHALLALTAYLGVLHLHRQGFPGLRTPKEIDAYVAHAAVHLIPAVRKRR
ncbi:MAG TPA: helix-turn-helix domain-containing protein [Thermoanaerobaculia bacterium]|nr:helix-turn-helix domain-containing protein [Thermoanaerobaculia bacterium]